MQPCSCSGDPGSWDCGPSRSQAPMAPCTQPVVQLSSGVSEKRTASVAFFLEDGTDSSTITQQTQISFPHCPTPQGSSLGLRSCKSRWPGIRDALSILFAAPDTEGKPGTGEVGGTWLGGNTARCGPGDPSQVTPPLLPPAWGPHPLSSSWAGSAEGGHRLQNCRAGGPASNSSSPPTSRPP